MQLAALSLPRAPDRRYSPAVPPFAERPIMPDAPPALRVYPSLWALSVKKFPRDEQWPDQFKHLCKLVKRFRREHRAEVLACGEGERLFLQALDQCDREDMIRTLRNEYPHENPMRRIDPSDPSVDKTQYPGIYPVQMNGKRYGHA
jgi:hypothetical protein